MLRRRLSITLLSSLLLASFAFTTARPAVAGPRICLETDDWSICLELPGIAGGGSLQTNTGVANVALFGTQITTTGDASNTIARGRVTWATTDANGNPLLLESVVVTGYGWIDGTEGGRWAEGLMSVNGEGEYPFRIEAVDAGPPGAGSDTVRLAVGDTAQDESPSNFNYEAGGTLTSGDLQILSFVDPIEPTPSN